MSSRPDPLGHAVVHDQQVEGARSARSRSRLARAGDVVTHLVALLAQGAAERLEDLLLVVDEEDGAAGHTVFLCVIGPRPCNFQSGPALKPPARPSGSRSYLGQRPGHARITVMPPSASTMFFAIARPSPVPRPLVVKYGSNTCGRSAGVMPVPRSHGDDARDRSTSRGGAARSGQAVLVPGGPGDRLPRVGQDVDEGRPQALAVGDDGRRGPGPMDARRRRRLRRTGGGRRVPAEGVEVGGRVLQADGPREVEHVVHDRLSRATSSSMSVATSAALGRRERRPGAARAASP